MNVRSFLYENGLHGILEQQYISNLFAKHKSQDLRLHNKMEQTDRRNLVVLKIVSCQQQKLLQAETGCTMDWVMMKYYSKVAGEQILTHVFQIQLNDLM